jgi:transposase-like protein
MVKSESGEIPLDTPRNRDGTFAPRAVPKRQRRIGILDSAMLDAIAVKVHRDSRVVTMDVHIALGVNMSGRKELLGMRIAETEGTKLPVKDWPGQLVHLLGTPSPQHRVSTRPSSEIRLSRLSRNVSSSN